jgi:group I intron endonuclease
MYIFDKDNNRIPSKAGIYLLRNKINNKIYIGKSINLYKRIYRHKNDSKYNNSIYICLAINKYGWNNFEVEILEKFDNIDNDFLLKIEAEYIKKYNSTDRKIGYNLLAFGTDKTGFKASAETLRKMSIAASGKNNGNWGKKLSEEHRQLLIESNKRLKRKPVKQIDLKTGEIIRIWESSVHAAVGIGITTGSEIRRVCNKTIREGYLCRTAHGFLWEHANKKELDNFLSNNT